MANNKLTRGYLDRPNNPLKVDLIDGIITGIGISTSYNKDKTEILDVRINYGDYEDFRKNFMDNEVTRVDQEGKKVDDVH